MLSFLDGKYLDVEFLGYMLVSECVCSVMSDSLQPHGLYVACQAPLSMGFFRQESWSGLPFPSPEYLPDPGIKPASLALTGGFFTSEPPGKPHKCHSLSFSKWLMVVLLRSSGEEGGWEGQLKLGEAGTSAWQLSVGSLVSWASCFVLVHVDWRAANFCKSWEFPFVLS